MEVIRERAAKRRAEQETRRMQRSIENKPANKPWLQFRSPADRFRWRYQNDPAFAQRERERAIVYRFTHPELVAKWEKSSHWRLAAARSDGSVTKKVVRCLLRATSCYLCGVELTAANRSIDHRVALTLGGNHTASNLAPCCQPCNREKARHERRQARETRKRQRVVRYTACVISERAAVPLTPLKSAGAGDRDSSSVGEK
jgi:5-methylcytosine-specific restriction endonuclease McrA